MTFAASDKADGNCLNVETPGGISAAGPFGHCFGRGFYFEKM
jgi:hypothetical protein